MQLLALILATIGIAAIGGYGLLGTVITFFALLLAFSIVTGNHT